MVSWDGGYFGTLFKWFQRVTQGDPVPSTIINVVVYAVIRNWLKLVVSTESVSDGFIRLVHRMVLFFYSYKFFLVSTHL